jgi:uncharacterized membrane protein (UPF0127 family)
MWKNAAIVIVALAPSACESQPAQPAQWWTVPMQIGAQRFNLEVADTPEAQRAGLMFRKSLPADQGMIFVFSREQPQEFWMKNTYVPLDIIYVDSTGKVVSIHPMEPLNTKGVPSDGPAQYAIELNRGAAAKAGVKVGDVLTLPERVRKPQNAR